MKDSEGKVIEAEDICEELNAKSKNVFTVEDMLYPIPSEWGGGETKMNTEIVRLYIIRLTQEFDSCKTHSPNGVSPCALEQCCSNT